MREARWGLWLAVVGMLTPAVGCAKSGPETDPRADAADGEEEPFEPWDEVLEDTGEISGYLTLHLKRDNTVYLEIPESGRDTDFGLTMHISRGAGVFNVHRAFPCRVPA